MSPKSYLISGLAVVAVMTLALPAAKGFSTASKEFPTIEVNRAAKGDRMVNPQTIAVKKAPVRAPAQPATPAVKEQSDKRQIMDGCEPAFSAVTMPSLAHISGRCIG
jgi:hypothetical protein